VKEIQERGVIKAMIEYIDISVEKIDLIKPLWEKLRGHQSESSIDFGIDLKKVTWEKRKKDIISSNRRLKMILVKDLNLNKYIGYCVSSITNQIKGEIDSIYIEMDYRKSGIGSELMKKSLRWFEEEGIEDIYISVVVGNEAVLDFYGKFGFKPRTYYLKNQSFKR